MKKKSNPRHRFILPLLLIFCLLFASAAYAGQQSLKQLEDAKFFWGTRTLSFLKNKIKEAQNEIIVYQYLIMGQDYVPSINELLKLLRRRANNGIRIQFYLDGSRKDIQGRPLNRAVKSYFDTVPAQFKILPEDEVMHSKVVFIDTRQALIGSQNWTKRGLTQNIETAFFVEDPGFVKKLKKKMRSSLPEDKPEEKEDVQKLQPGEKNINQVTPEELTSVPSIGPYYADKIVNFRQKKGRVRNIEKLKTIEGIGKKRMSELRKFFGR